MTRTKKTNTRKNTPAGKTQRANPAGPVAATRDPHPHRTKVGTATAAPAPLPAIQADGQTGTKLAEIVAQLRRPEGATIADLMQLTGWLSHSVRGALSGALKRKLGLTVTSSVEAGRDRVYRIVEPPKPARLIPTSADPASRPAKLSRSKRPSNGTGAIA